MNSPLTPWSDAPSTFASSPYLDSSRNGSSTSLWTASSASSIMEEKEDVDSELQCLELLAKLEREKRRKSAEAKREQARTDKTSHHVRDDSFPDVVEPLNLDKARAARHARYGSSNPQSNPPSTSLSYDPEASTSRQLKRLSSRLSFTTTDLAELDIEAILDAYTSEAFTAPLSWPRPVPRNPLPRSNGTFDLQGEMQSPPTNALPELPPISRRLSIAPSVRSIRSTGSCMATNDERSPARRSGPFPTITRQRSNASLASRKPSLDTTCAPPVPQAAQSAFPTSVPMSNRTFSSFSRQSDMSTTSVSSASSLPMRSQPGSSRISYASSTMSRQSSAPTTGSSFRWSFATSSTVPTVLSDGSSDCGMSRRGSLAPSVGSSKQSPNRSRRRPTAAPFSGSPMEHEEEDAQPWSQSTRLSRRDEREEEDARDGGLISWEDFADELASLPVPNRPNPRRMNSQASSHSSRSRKTSNASSYKSSFPNPSSNPFFASPEATHSTSTLTSAPSSKSSSPFPSAPSPTNSRSGKKGLLQGLRGMKSTRDLSASFS
ncbi:uncharacterized protein JCM15063_001975 [Sporobolomyces koalae]|uniref:uncharacterized protein n=1 Tax=Sporobolomyces koalae TaxID=500713 RepID=UPI00316DF3E3